MVVEGEPFPATTSALVPTLRIVIAELGRSLKWRTKKLLTLPRSPSPLHDSPDARANSIPGAATLTPLND